PAATSTTCRPTSGRRCPSTRRCRSARCSSRRSSPPAPRRGP
ncbi:MAG: hypothetical protein AVDCRST_MAG30-1048, partial [uncultured Solirubrobacteraceae bacterium]